MSKNSELKEQKFDAMLKPALYEQMMKEMEEMEIPDERHEFSRSFERKMKRMVRSVGKSGIHYGRFKVAVAVAVVAVFGVVTMNVEALRVPIHNMFMGDTHSTVDYGGKKGEIEIPEEYAGYVPEYVVEGYELVYAYADAEICFLQYNDLDGQEYIISIYMKDERKAFDTEEGEVSEIKIGDYDVVMVEKDGRIWINFIMNNIGYIIEGSIELSEIEKILDSVG